MQGSILYVIPALVIQLSIRQQFESLTENYLMK